MVDPFRIMPRLPTIDGIFDLGSNILISSNPPHGRIEEHLHDHHPHMHIRYGFEIPQQQFRGLESAALEVGMYVKKVHRVDCNPVFVARGEGSEGVCWKVGGEDVHWVHNEEVGEKAARAWQRTGRKLADDYRWSGFRTSDLAERRVRRYTRYELLAAVGQGVRCDQHFQATWVEPRAEAIEPYDVVIYLSDDASPFETFFNLPTTISLGAF